MVLSFMLRAFPPVSANFTAADSFEYSDRKHDLSVNNMNVGAECGGKRAGQLNVRKLNIRI